MYVNGWNVGLLRPRLWPFIIWRIVRPTWRLLSSIWMPPFSVVVCYFLHSLSCWCWSCFCCLALASVNGGITTNNGTFTLNTRTRHETYIELTKQNRTIPTFVCWVYNDRMSIEQWGYSLSSLSILECVEGNFLWANITMDEWTPDPNCITPLYRSLTLASTIVYHLTIVFAMFGFLT